MNKSGKLILEIIGIGCTIWGIVTFIKDEKVVYVISLGVILLTIIFFIIRDLTSRPITYLHNKTIYRILDESGKKIIQEKIKVFKVNEKNINTLFDPGYEASGKINFIGTSIGEMLTPTKEGGCMTFVTYFKIPLKKGHTYTQTITTEYIDSFIDSKESVGFRMEKKYKDVELVVHFPENRICKNARTFLFNGDQGDELTKPSFFDGGKRIELFIDKPILNARYAIEVEW